MYIRQRADVLSRELDEFLQTWTHLHNQDPDQETEKCCNPRSLPHDSLQLLPPKNQYPAI